MLVEEAVGSDSVVRGSMLRSRLGGGAVYAIAAQFFVILVTTVVVLYAENLVVAAYLPISPRVTTDFSAGYLQRELQSLAAHPPQTLLIGDSVLWGYYLPPSATAAAIMQSRGCECINLAFKGGNPANYYGIALLLRSNGVHPKNLLLEVNQKVLSQLDMDYSTMNPSVARLSLPLMTQSDRGMLSVSSAQPTPMEHVLSRISSLYAMRSDIREALYGDSDSEPPTKRLTAADFAGAYDLSPLTSSNVGVHFLKKSVKLLRSSGIHVVAFLTPTNHRLLHDYIDTSAYDANAAYLKNILRSAGAQVVDFDKAIPPSDFFDNDHLTTAGQQRLAVLLARAMDGDYPKGMK